MQVVVFCSHTPSLSLSTYIYLSRSFPRGIQDTHFTGCCGMLCNKVNTHLYSSSHCLALRRLWIVSLPGFALSKQPARRRLSVCMLHMVDGCVLLGQRGAGCCEKPGQHDLLGHPGQRRGLGGRSRRRRNEMRLDTDIR